MDVLFFCYFILIIVAVAINKKESSVDYLSVEYTTNFRGIAAIGVILHHMSERINAGVFFSKLSMIGYLLVTLFFFLSGYGLLVQYQKKKDGYLKGFLKKRVLYLGLIYCFDVCVNYPYAYFTISTSKAYINSDDDIRGVMTVDLTDPYNVNPYITVVPKEFVSQLSNGDPNPTRIALLSTGLITNNGELGCSYFEFDSFMHPTYCKPLKMPAKGSINAIYYNKEKRRLVLADDANGGETYTASNIYWYNINI